ncbi:hypothetical protein PV326_004394 [Microctonus aethiopoides]|nr:hypothetical protein PV326_004394 [Microctonus aethiopoides]
MHREKKCRYGDRIQARPNPNDGPPGGGTKAFHRYTRTVCLPLCEPSEHSLRLSLHWLLRTSNTSPAIRIHSFESSKPIALSDEGIFLSSPCLGAKICNVRHNINYDPKATAQDLKRILSRYLKRVPSESLNPASASTTLRTVEAEIHHSTANVDEIRPLAPSRPASPPQPNTNDVLLQAVRNELLKMREQIFDHIQTQLAQPETPKRKPVPSPRTREPLQTRHHQNRLDDDLFVTSQVRRWDATFHGEKNVLTFLERIDEMRMNVHLTDRQLLECIPIVLKGTALQRYGNNRSNWLRWSDLPTIWKISPFQVTLTCNWRKKSRTEHKAQKKAEKTSSSTECRQVDRIHLNLRPEYEHYIRRHQVNSINHIIKLADDHERLLAKEKSCKVPPAASQSIMLKTAYNKPTKSNANNTDSQLQAINMPYQRRDCPCVKPANAFQPRALQTNPSSNQPSNPPNTSWVNAPAFEPQPGPSRQNLNPVTDRASKDTRQFVITLLGTKIYKGLIDSGAMSSFLNSESMKEVLEQKLGTITASALKVAVADGRHARIAGKTSGEWSVINTLPEENEMTEDDATIIIQEEMAQFVTITSPTTVTEHVIRVKPQQQLIKRNRRVIQSVELTSGNREKEEKQV